MNEEPTPQRFEWDHTPWGNTHWNRLHGGKHWVYFVYAVETGDLLYVGQTNDLLRRSREHHCGAYSRSDVRWEVEGPYTAGSAMTAERRHIIALRPRDNNKTAHL